MRLVERDDECAALADHWQRALDGSGGMVVVRGEPGAGKTSLIETFVAGLGDNVPALWGSCDPLATPRPLGPVHDVARQLGGSVPALLREAELPHTIFEAVFEQLSASPTVLVVDDLHWADQGTIDLLRFVLRRIGDTRSLVIGMARDEEAGPTHALLSLLGDVARSPDATSIAVRPLSVEAIGVLLGDRDLDPALLHRLTGGNPFFVVEMLDHRGDELPANVRDAILARTSGLDDEAWDVLHLLACAPEAIPDQLLARLSVGLPPLLALDRAGLIRRGARGVAFRHDLCRMAIAAAIPPGGEVSLHRRMLDALDASAVADPAVLVHHALGAGDEQRARAFATEAGRAATRSGAHSQAASFFRTALEHGGPLPPADEAELLESLAHEAYLMDRLDQAIAASERAMMLRARADDAAGVSANHHAMAVYEWYSANRSIAEEHVELAISVLADHETESGDRDRLGHAFATQAFLAMQASDIPRAHTLITHAAELAATSTDQGLRARVSIIAATREMVSDAPGGRERLLSILGSPDDHFDEIYSSGYSNLSYLDIEQRRFEQAAQVLDLSLPLTLERDVPICHVWQVGTRGRLQLLSGEWDLALADANAVLAGPSAPLARTWPHLVRGLIMLRRTGEPAADLDAAWDLASRLAEPIRVLPAAAALVEQMWLTGRADQRLATYRRLLDEAPRTGLDWGRGELAIWLRRLDVERGESPGDESPGNELDGVAEPFQLALTGDYDAAAAAWDRLMSPYEAALALVESGDAGQCRRGFEILDQLGATAIAAKLRRDLRVAGVQVVPGPRRSTTMANRSGLTTRELEVLQLLDEGLTNGELAQRLFLSQRTVDHHVSAIIVKLGVQNRREAVRTARQVGLID